MSDDTMRDTPSRDTDAAVAATASPPSTVPHEGDASPDATGGANGAASGTGAPRKPRRGSRGGRHRKKPSSANATGGAANDDERHGPEDENDEGADRGLTTDDVAAEAREEAGLPAGGTARPARQLRTTEGPPSERPPAEAARPRIGDT